MLFRLSEALLSKVSPLFLMPWIPGEDAAGGQAAPVRPDTAQYLFPDGFIQTQISRRIFFHLVL